MKKHCEGVDLGAAETGWMVVEATVGGMERFRLWWSSRYGKCGLPTRYNNMMLQVMGLSMIPRGSLHGVL